MDWAHIFSSKKIKNYFGHRKALKETLNRFVLKMADKSIRSQIGTLNLVAV